jgi:hypothetical protein
MKLLPKFGIGAECPLPEAGFCQKELKSCCRVGRSS